MDSREKIKNAGADRSFFCDEFTRRGVKCFTTTLEIADFLWVAKQKNNDGDPTLIVLDFLVERKASFDLVSSIKDNRFKEQKFRMQNSGIRNCIYLVEECQMDEASFEMGKDTIRTALTTTQLGGFILKRSRNPESSVEYLTEITNFIKRKLAKSDIIAIPTAGVSGNYKTMRQEWESKNPGSEIYTTLEAYNSELNSKNENFTRKDVFTRQLMTVKLVSEEKAAGLANLFPTFQSLKRAYAECPEADRPKFLQNRSDTGTRREIGQALSKKIAELFCADTYQ